MALLRRSKPGCRAKEFRVWPDAELDDMDSVLSGQQYLQQLIRKGTPVHELMEAPESLDPAVWQYEHLRQLCADLSILTTELAGVCTEETCPTMVLDDDSQYLCAAHTPPKECTAFNYISHTVDMVTSILTSSKHFPSRISIPAESVKQFQYQTRRLYRIIAHAYFHHRDLYDEFEGRTAVAHRVVMFAKHYRLMPKNLLTIPF
eukprot:Clim_evm38s207 gene=Clim_evmTU38s207